MEMGQKLSQVFYATKNLKRRWHKALWIRNLVIFFGEWRRGRDWQLLGSLRFNFSYGLLLTIFPDLVIFFLTLLK
ncbi:hypothetical protein IEQ34_003469 [Dendrobium chrysotoxum]|uniref:Uncharacterized protein n=1 Tax=Dendrobium chrysotoxum TaxID=161865 RepID=A0AAV7HHC8_DENCH|nr:hypothetical protein IEQ34_003469 [Dendrobium chrysotoxum]